MGLLNKPPLKKRIKEVDKELAGVSQTLRALTQSVEPNADADAAELENPPPVVISAPVSRGDARGQHVRDERFADYLSSSFQPVRPLKHERTTQRNKAIVMSVFVLLVLIWVASRFFL